MWAPPLDGRGPQAWFRGISTPPTGTGNQPSANRRRGRAAPIPSAPERSASVWSNRRRNAPPRPAPHARTVRATRHAYPPAVPSPPAGRRRHPATSASPHGTPKHRMSRRWRCRDSPDRSGPDEPAIHPDAARPTPPADGAWPPNPPGRPMRRTPRPPRRRGSPATARPPYGHRCVPANGPRRRHASPASVPPPCNTGIAGPARSRRNPLPRPHARRRGGMPRDPPVGAVRRGSSGHG